MFLYYKQMFLLNAQIKHFLWLNMNPVIAREDWELKLHALWGREKLLALAGFKACCSIRVGFVDPLQLT
jgi:hypothetical protein